MSAAPDVVLAIDQGTTGTTALLLDAAVRVVAQFNVEFPNHYPSPGLVEHDTDEIWASVQAAVRGALRQAGPVTLRAIGITNQRETCLFWDRATGQPIHRALVWQDRRTADTCRRLKEEGREPWVRARTGLVLDPYFSATKAAWLLDHVPGARAAAEAGTLAFGTIDAYLAFRLCGAHATDASNASRTLLFNLHTGDWDPELCPSVQPAHRRLGPGALFALRRTDGLPAAHLRQRRSARLHRGARLPARRHPRGRHGGRPAVGALWTGLLHAGHGQVYLWHWCLCTAQHRRRDCVE